MANDTEVYASATGEELLILLEILAVDPMGTYEPTPRQERRRQLFWEYLDLGDVGLQASKLYSGDLEGLHNFLLDNEEAIKDVSFKSNSLTYNAGGDMSNAVCLLLSDIRTGKVSLPE